MTGETATVGSVEDAEACAKQSKLFDLSNGKWDIGETVLACGALLVGGLACWGLISKLLGWIKTIAIGAALLMGGGMLLKAFTGKGFLDWIPSGAKQWIKENLGFDLTKNETVVGAAEHVVDRATRNMEVKYGTKAGLEVAKGMKKMGASLEKSAMNAADKLAEAAGKAGMKETAEAAKGMYQFKSTDAAGKTVETLEVDASKMIRGGKNVGPVVKEQEKAVKELIKETKTEIKALKQNRTWGEFVKQLFHGNPELKQQKQNLKWLRSEQRTIRTLGKAAKKSIRAGRWAKYVGKPLAKFGGKAAKCIPFVGWAVGVWCAGEALLRRDKNGKISWDWELAGCELASGALGGCTGLSFGLTAVGTAAIETYMAGRRKQKYGTYL